MSEILLFSGGCDSYIAWLKLGRPKVMHFTQHSRYSKQEMVAVKNLCIKHPDLWANTTIIKLPFLRQFEHEDAWLPARNMLFATIAANYADKIFLPCQRGERDVEDRTEGFFGRMSSELSIQFRAKKIVDPTFWDETKADLVGWYVANYPTRLGNLRLTYSCFTGKSRRCGRCSSCFRLWVALEYNSIPTSDWFENDPAKWDGVSGYVQRLQEGKYEQRRAEQTIEVLKSKNILE